MTSEPLFDFRIIFVWWLLINIFSSTLVGNTVFFFFFVTIVACEELNSDPGWSPSAARKEQNRVKGANFVRSEVRDHTQISAVLKKSKRFLFVNLNLYESVCWLLPWKKASTKPSWCKLLPHLGQSAVISPVLLKIVTQTSINSYHSNFTRILSFHPWLVKIQECC